MLNLFRHVLYKILIRREEEEMMAMLFATKIILGKAEFGQVPAKLKAQVAEILLENGCEDLITEEEYLPQVNEVK